MWMPRIPSHGPSPPISLNADHLKAWAVKLLSLLPARRSRPWRGVRRLAGQAKRVRCSAIHARRAAATRRPPAPRSRNSSDRAARGQFASARQRIAPRRSRPPISVAPPVVTASTRIWDHHAFSPNLRLSCKNRADRLGKATMPARRNPRAQPNQRRPAVDAVEATRPN